MRKKLHYIIHVSVFTLILMVFVGCSGSNGGSDTSQTPQSVPSSNWEEVIIPNEFTAGENAVAAKVNENLDAIETEVNDNVRRITLIESAVSDNAATISSNAGSISTNKTDISEIIDRLDRVTTQLECASANYRFCDMGNGTVKDMSSGFIWLKDASALGRRTWHDATGTESATTNVISDFNSGLISATDYTAGTYTDWRVPDKDELISFVNDTESIRCTSGSCNVGNFIRVQSDGYWSRTEGAPDGAWYVHTLDGYVGTGGMHDSGYVWPVRSDS
jgi:hypothetical protein